MFARRPKYGPPDFVGVGTQRSGTTWWFAVLIEHPAIRLYRKKEMHFFDRFCRREMTRREIARYHERFERMRGTITGEWTPRYMYDFWTPRLLHRAAPKAKLLVLLRDPIERFRSGFAHQLSLSTGRPEQVSFHDALNRSRYAWQLARLFELFDREQVLVLQYERCTRDPLGEYARTLRFLGVADDFEPAGLQQLTGRTTASSKRPLAPDLEALLKAELEPDVLALRSLVDDLDLGLWRNFAHLGAEQLASVSTP